MSHAFERAYAAWRAVSFEHLPLIILHPSGCTYVQRDGARYGVGILRSTEIA